MVSLNRIVSEAHNPWIRRSTRPVSLRITSTMLNVVPCAVCTVNARRNFVRNERHQLLVEHQVLDCSITPTSFYRARNNNPKPDSTSTDVHNNENFAGRQCTIAIIHNSDFKIDLSTHYMPGSNLTNYE